MDEQFQLASIDKIRGSNIANLAAMEQTRAIAHTLAQNNDPKFQDQYEMIDYRGSERRGREIRSKKGQEK